MKEYIERAMAFAVLVDFPGELSPENIGLAVARKAIDALPAADVAEVVRCKDCQYYQDAKTNKKGFLICPAFGMEIAETDYCSYGARMGKPRICEVLGVEVNQNFQFNDFPFDEPKTYFVGANGEIRNARGGEVTSSELCYIINNADYIIRKPRWTEEEIVIAELILSLYERKDIVFGRYENGQLWWKVGNRAKNDFPNKFFPSIRPSNEFDLIEIIGGAE